MEKYYPLPGSDINNKPKLISEDQITDIINSLPDLPAVDYDNRLAMQQEREDWIRRSLKNKYLCPDAFLNLKLKIIKAYVSSLVLPGNTMMECGQNIQSQNTQNNISSFHQAGYVNNASGRVQTKDIVNANTEEINKGITLHLQDKTLTLQQVRTFGEKLVETKVSDCITKYTISKIKDGMLEDYEFSHINDSFYDITGQNKNVIYDWLNYDENFDDLSDLMICRLYLDLDIMFRRKITINKIANAIESEDLYIFHEHARKGFIDLVATVNVIAEDMVINERTTLDQFLTFYYETFVVKSFPELYVSGIKGVAGSTVMSIPYVELFDFSYEDETFYIKSNDKNLKTVNVSAEALEAPLEVIIELENEKDPNNPVDINLIKLESNIVEFKMNRNESFLRDMFSDIPLKRSDLSKYFEYNYLSLSGSGYCEILGLPEVDSNITTTNDVQVLSTCLGIECARKYLYNAYHNNVQSVHPSNIIPYADIQTINGKPSSISENGSGTQVSGPFSSLRNPASKFKVFSADNKTENLNIQPSIATGTRLKIGVNYCDVFNINEDGNTRLKFNGTTVKAFIGDEIPYYEKKKNYSFELNKNEMKDADIKDEEGNIINFSNNSDDPRTIILNNNYEVPETESHIFQEPSIDLFDFNVGRPSQFILDMLNLS